MTSLLRTWPLYLLVLPLGCSTSDSKPEDDDSAGAQEPDATRDVDDGGAVSSSPEGSDTGDGSVDVMGTTAEGSETRDAAAGSTGPEADPESQAATSNVPTMPSGSQFSDAGGGQSGQTTDNSGSATTAPVSDNTTDVGESGQEDPAPIDGSAYCGEPGTATLIDEAGDPKTPDAPLTEEAVEGSACNATLRTFPIKTSHVTPCTAVNYGSNPPSSGMHYSNYPRYGVYSSPLVRGFSVHLLEHGGVVLSYSCTDCDAEVEQAKTLAETLPFDERCCVDGECPEGATNRAVLTPDPAINTRWAAATWGKTLTADCFELEIFEKFAAENRGFGIENFCTNAGATDISQPPP